MAQIVGCLDGMGEACRALDFPIVSGNVASTTRARRRGGGSAILPTPAIGGGRAARRLGEERDDRVQGRGRGHRPDRPFATAMSASRCGCDECHGRSDGPPPPVDLAAETRAGEFIRAADRATGCQRGPRRLRRRRCGRGRGNGAGRRTSASTMTVVDKSPTRPRSCSARTRDAMSSPTTSRRRVQRAAANAAKLFAVAIGTTGGEV